MRLKKTHDVDCAVEILSREARRVLQEEGWTLFVTYWEDDTFQLEYRHTNEDGIHRFIYTPHHTPPKIIYWLYTWRGMEKTLEGLLEFEHDIKKMQCIYLK